MNKPAVHPAAATTMSKAEVCKYLGRSKRTIETYITSGRLPAKYYNGPNGKTLSFERADVEAVKASKGEVWETIATVRPSAPPSGIALVPAAVTEFKPLIERLVRLAEFAQENSARHTLPVYVSLKEACALTGLSAATIKASGAKTMPFGNGVRYRRADLEAL